MQNPGPLHHKELLLLKARMHLFEAWHLLSQSVNPDDPRDKSDHEQAADAISTANGLLILAYQRVEAQLEEAIGDPEKAKIGLADLRRLDEKFKLPVALAT